MYDTIYQAALNAKDLNALKKAIGEQGERNVDAFTRKKCRLFITVKEPALGTIFYAQTPAEQLAAEGHHKAAELLRQCGADLDFIARGYAFANNEERVQHYKNMHQANVNYIACGYMKSANHNKVNDYITTDKVSSIAMAHYYAIYGNDEEIPGFLSTSTEANSAEYHRQVLFGYIIANKQALVDRYSLNYKIPTQHILECYQRAGNESKKIEYRDKLYQEERAHEKQEYTKLLNNNQIDAVGLTSFEKLLTYKKPVLSDNIDPLNASNKVIDTLIQSLLRLYNGKTSSFNPYWINSSTKYELITKAILALPENADLAALIQEEQSDLHRALNHKRLISFTFFTGDDYMQAKSLLSVSEFYKTP
ncbi:MAG: hypothetical protein ACHP6H_05925, partial [Legionellales bacterium]